MLYSNVRAALMAVIAQSPDPIRALTVTPEQMAVLCRPDLQEPYPFPPTFRGIPLVVVR